MPLLDDLYSQSPGAAPTQAAAPAVLEYTPTPAQATAAQAETPALGDPKTADTTHAQATGYDAHTQDVSAANLASNQLNDITSQDSPLMKRARQEGILAAAKRGLQNSSIAAGAAQGAVVDRATPLAQANAAALNTQSLANQAAINQAREVSTGRETAASSQNATMLNDTSKFNATQQNQTNLVNAQLQSEIARMNAQLQTATSQGNAQEANALNTRIAELRAQLSMNNANNQQQANNLTSTQENAMRIATMQQNAELNRQYLQGTQQNDLETIRGRFDTLLSSNRAASDLYNVYFQTIAATMNNSNLQPDRVAQIVQLQQEALAGGLELIDAINSTQLPSAPVGVAPPTSIPNPVSSAPKSTPTIQPQ